MLVFTAVGVLIGLNDGLAQRVPAVARAYAAAAVNEHSVCYIDLPEQLTSESLCDIGVPTAGTGNLLLWGDSHAAAIAPGVDAAAQAADSFGWLVAQQRCPPLLGVTRANAYGDYNCSEINDRVIEFIVENRISTVILAARWSASLGPRPLYEQRAGIPDALLVDGQSEVPAAGQNIDVFVRGLGRTLRRLEEIGVTTWLVEEVPYVGHATPSALARMAALGRPFDLIAPLTSEHAVLQSVFGHALEQLPGGYELRLIDPADALCERGAPRCSIAHEGQSLYMDDDHLSPYGARYVQDIFMSAVTETGATEPRPD